MDVARLAATTDELAHIPSIGNVANIFTQMLQQLQVSYVVPPKHIYHPPTFLRN